MVQDRLSGIVIISIEHDMYTNLNYNDIIEKFTEMKARKLSF